MLQGFLLYQGCKILVFKHLSSEVLIKRRGLKPVTAKLPNVHYKWDAVSNVLVRHQGKAYCGSDDDSGYALLQALNIEIPMEVSKKS